LSQGSTLADPHSRHNNGPGNALLVTMTEVDYFLHLKSLKPLDHDNNPKFCPIRSNRQG
jgi:hypothetical protein